MITYSTEPTSYGGYILTDGRFINFKEQQIGTIDFVTHFTFDFHELHNNRERCLVECDNAIAFNDAVVKRDLLKQERAYIQLPAREPTKEQYESLLKWLYHTLYVSETIDIHGRGFRLVSFQFISKDNDEGYTPEQIIKEIPTSTMVFWSTHSQNSEPLCKKSCYPRPPC